MGRRNSSDRTERESDVKRQRTAYLLEPKPGRDGVLVKHSHGVQGKLL
jgi:hypothetical protein